MFDSVRNNKKIVQIFLALITLPFAFFGVESYISNMGAGNDVASVGDSKISAAEFDQALRERQDQLRRALGENFQSEMMNTPEAKLAVLNTLIDRRLLLLEANKNNLMTSDEALRDFISKVPSLQVDGKFSQERYETVIRAQGKSQPQFEAMLRQDLTLQQLIGAVSDSAFVSDSQAEAMLRLQSEERQFSESKVAPEQFADKVKIDEAAVQKYYDDNKTRFEVPEQVKAEFIMLSMDALMAQATLGESDAKTWYDDHKDRYMQPEERRASHILIEAKVPADKEKAKVKAEEVLKEVQGSPDKFADLAKKYSQDTGSAANGGDLGFFGQGMMVKPFEDAVFKLKDGEISGLVESDFGFHIIKLTGIKASKQRPFDEVKAEIEGELKRQAASRKFTEEAESFSNTVYEQSDSLQPAVDKFKLKLQQSPLITKNPDPASTAALGPLGNAKVLAALFSDDAIKNKRNIEAVEVAPNTLLSARVLEHVEASSIPFDKVKADIEKQLVLEESARQAKTSGEATLAELKKSGDDKKLSWSAAKTLSRMQGQQLAPEAVKAIFRADTEKLPAYEGAAVGDGYTLYRIEKVIPLATVDVEKRKSLQNEYGSLIAREDLSAYLASLRARYKIDINKAKLEAKDRQ